VTAAPVLSVRDLSVRVATPAGPLRAVRGVSFDIAPGEALGLVGESGSGKTLTCRAILRLDAGAVAIDGGSIMLGGERVETLDEPGLRRVRGALGAMVFQNPAAHLDPVMRVGDQIAEPVRLRYGLSRRAALERATELLAQVGIPDARLRRDAYPHEFSGGMRQRVMIAAALACEPKLLIADEPTSALDVTVQAQILRLLHDLRQRLGLALLLVTHDLGVVAQVCDRIAVMYAGRIVETGPKPVVLGAPAHPYTRGLIASQPGLDGAPGLPTPIPGLPPSLRARPPGCAFAPRCGFARAECSAGEPPALEVGRGHAAACIRWRAVAEAA
jgi:oligopeptide/dipeptide ABC transporter ATP-binding protein